MTASFNSSYPAEGRERPRSAGEQNREPVATRLRCLRVDSQLGYTNGMKTAVSIPDAIFERAELFARSAKRSRSQLFSDALAEYLARHSGDEITDAMNRVIDATGNAVDPFTSAASQRALARVEW